MNIKSVVKIFYKELPTLVVLKIFPLNNKYTKYKEIKDYIINNSYRFEKYKDIKITKNQKFVLEIEDYEIPGLKQIWDEATYKYFCDIISEKLPERIKLYIVKVDNYPKDWSPPQNNSILQKSLNSGNDSNVNKLNNKNIQDINQSNIEAQLNKQNNINRSLENKIKELITENKNLIEENTKLKNENNDLINIKISLTNELNNERIKVNQLNEKLNSINYINNNKYLELEKIFDNKNKEISELKLKLNENTLNKILPGEKIIAVGITSVNQKINCILPCKNTDLFVRIEEKLYKDYPEYKDKESYFIVNGKKVKRFKTLEENNIKNGNSILLYILDE